MKYFNAEQKLLLAICIFLTLNICIPAVQLIAQNIPKQFKDLNLNCTYNIKDGMFNGKYLSFYPNGNRKSEGEFKNNNRIGKWTIWDSTENKICEREYKNAFVYKQNFPLNPHNYTLLNKRDSNDIIKEFFIKEAMIYTFSKTWRMIYEENNPNLFENDRLSKLLINSMLNSKVTAYDIADEEFTKPLSIQQLKEKFEFDKLEIKAYKIKEVWFLDTVRKISEVRILGICPVAKSKNENAATQDLCWFYFPDIRKVLASEKIRSNKIFPVITNMDDIFVFRHFASKIIKEDNPYNKAIKNYKSGRDIEIEAEKIELKLIELEHDFWMLFTKK